MGNPCVSDAEGIHIDVRMRHARAGDQEFGEGALITIDSTTGAIYLGELAMIEAEFSVELAVLLQMADAMARLRVMANADTPLDTERALKFGAMDIDLCRIERLPIMIEMIVDEIAEERQSALDKLIPIQCEDFKTIFTIMSPFPVTIRLLDPPIHEFLPTEHLLVEDLEHLHHLREILRGMQVLSDAVMFMNQTRDNQPQVQKFTDPVLVDEAIVKKKRQSYERPGPCTKSTLCWAIAVSVRVSRFRKFTGCRSGRFSKLRQRARRLA